MDHQALAHLPHAAGTPLVPVSGITRKNLDKLMDACVKVHKDWSARVKTRDLNDWLSCRASDQGGVEGDVATFWRWREARRYGATAIFIRRNADIKARRLEAADLADGLDPVFATGSELQREPELLAA
jgi:hypothetical protein